MIPCTVPPVLVPACAAGAVGSVAAAGVPVAPAAGEAAARVAVAGAAPALVADGAALLPLLDLLLVQLPQPTIPAAARPKPATAPPRSSRRRDTCPVASRRQ